MRPTSNTPRTSADFHLSKHDKKIEQRAKDFMDIFKNFDFSPAGHITCLIHLLDPSEVKLGKGPAAENFNRKFAQFSNELDLALGKSKKESNRNELKMALIAKIAARGLPFRYQNDYQKVSNNCSTDVVINWLKEIRKQINPPKTISRPHSQVVTSTYTTNNANSNQILPSAAAPVFRAFNYSPPAPVQYTAPNPSSPAPMFSQAPATTWNQGQSNPGNTNWPQQQWHYPNAVPQQQWQSQNVMPQQQQWQYPNAVPQQQQWQSPSAMPQQQQWHSPNAAPQQQQWQSPNVMPQQQYFYPPQQNGRTPNSGS